MNLNGGSVSGAGTLKDQGTLGVNSAQTLANPLVVQGTVTGNSPLSITGAMTTNGGSFSGPGWVTVQGGATWNTPASGSISVNGGSLINDGTATIGASGSLDVTSGVTVTNNGTMTMEAGSEIYGYNTTSVFANPGTLVVSPGSTGTATLGNTNYLVVNNTGSIQITSGTLEVLGATLNLNGGSVSGAGTLKDQGTLGINSAQTLANPLVVQGTVTGNSPLSITGAMTTNGGSFSGPGTVILSGSATWSAASSTSISGGALVNNGTATVTGSASIYVGSGTTVTNAGEMTWDSGSQISGADATSALANVGTLVVVNTGSSGTVTFSDLVVNSTGAIQITSGTLDISGGAILNLNGGSVSGPGTLDDQATLGVNSAQSLGGPLRIQGGSIDLAALETLNAPSLSSSSGTVQIDAGASNQFGRLSIGASTNVSNLSLSLATSFTPSCGTSVTALTAGAISGSWSSVQGTSLPPSGTWDPTTTSTTAGAYVYCPPPPETASLTYGDGSSIDAINASGYEAEPVNTGTGAYTSTETDAKLGGLGVTFNLSRSYTSSDNVSGPLGTGWTDSMNVTAADSGTGPGSTVTVSDENGAQVVYTENSDGSYSGPAGTRSLLASNGGGGWTVTRQNQDALTFNAFGELTSEVDRNGIGLHISYNGSNQLSTVTDFAGRVVGFTYNSSGLLTSMSLPLGRTVTYGHDSSNQLTSVKDAAGGVTSYTYDSAGLLATVTDQNGHQVVSNTYDAQGRVISQVNTLGKTAAFSYDPSTDTTTYTDPDGNQWKDVYQNGVLIATY